MSLWTAFKHAALSMQDKTDLTMLPDDATTVIFNQMELNTKYAFLYTNTRFYKLFKHCPLLMLLDYVVKGEQDKAEQLLKINPKLLLQKNDIIDYSGRQFLNVSAFQLAVWAWDVRYMATMMLRCIPRNEEGEAIRIALQSQMEDLINKGVTYLLNKTLVTESHYDFALVGVLGMYMLEASKQIKHIKDLEAKNFSPQDLEWMLYGNKKAWSKVGAHQWLLPAHIAQHYCDPDGWFSPENPPTFKLEKFNRTLKPYKNESKNNFWFSEELQSSDNFAMNRGNMFLMGGHAHLHGMLRSSLLNYYDFAALTILRTARTDDLKLLQSSLEVPLLNKEPCKEPRCIFL